MITGDCPGWLRQVSSIGMDVNSSRSVHKAQFKKWPTHDDGVANSWQLHACCVGGTHVAGQWLLPITHLVISETLTPVSLSMDSAKQLTSSSTIGLIEETTYIALLFGA